MQNIPYKSHMNSCSDTDLYSNTVWVCRAGVRTARAHLDLILARNVKDYKSRFYRYISSKRKRENMNPQLNRTGDLVIKDMEEAEVLGTFFTSVFTAKVCLQESWIIGNVWSEDDLLLVGEEKTEEHLSRWALDKSTGPDVMHPWVVKDLAVVIVRLLLIIFERSWWLEELPEDCKKANIIPLFNKDKREDLGVWSASPRFLGRLLSHSWKLFPNVLRTAWVLGAVSKDLQRGHLLWPLGLIPFYSEMTWLSRQGENSGVCLFWLDCSRALIFSPLKSP